MRMGVGRLISAGYKGGGERGVNNLANTSSCKQMMVVVEYGHGCVRS